MSAKDFLPPTVVEEIEPDVIEFSGYFIVRTSYTLQKILKKSAKSRKIKTVVGVIEETRQKHTPKPVYSKSNPPPENPIKIEDTRETRRRNN